MKKTRWIGVLLAGMLLLSLLPVCAHAEESFAFGKDLSMMCTVDGSTLTIAPRTEDSPGEIPVFAKIFLGGSYFVSSPWFSYSDRIETVILEEGVVNIPTNAFTGMSKLKSIHIPLSVKTIAADGFQYCSGLTDVYYAGLPGDWSNISISAMPRDYNFNTGTFTTPTNWLSRAVRHYADGSESGGGGSGGGSGGSGGSGGTTIIVNDGFTNPGSGTEGGIAYSYSDGTLTISPDGESGTMENYGFLGKPAWSRGRYLIKKVVIEDGVTNVGGGAFSDCENLTEVQLGNTVETIETYAFRLCLSLNKIRIPDNVTLIEEDAFNCCTAMETVTVDEGNPAYTAPDSVLYTKDMKTLVYYPAQRSGESYDVPEGVTAIAGVSFCDASGLEQITLPKTLKSIGYYAFEGCGFYEVELPEGLERMDEFVFNRCIQLERVTLPASLTDYGLSPFNRCTALKKITADPKSSTFADQDGVLFSKDGKTLFCYPAGKGAPAYAVPEGVENIGTYAFKQVSALTAIGLPSTLKDVGVGEIYDEVVHDNGFEDCEALKDVYYAGTREQWDAWAKDEENPSEDRLVKDISEGDSIVTMHWNTPMPDLPKAAVSDKKTTEGRDGQTIYSFTVNCGQDDASALFAVYDSSGRFLSMESYPLTEGKNELSFSPADENALTYKLFVLTDDGSVPLCESLPGDLYGGYTIDSKTPISS